MSSAFKGMKEMLTAFLCCKMQPIILKVKMLKKK
jgi:hypothetical protein